MGAAPGRAKTCKIMQIAFVRTSSSLPLTPVLPLLPAAPSPARRLPPIPSSRLSFSLPLSLLLVPLFLDHPLLPISPLFFAFSPLPLPSLLISALYSSVPQHLSPSSALFSFISLSMLRARERQKCFDDCMPRRLFLYFCRGGWNTRLGGAAPAAGAHRGWNLARHIYVSLSRVGSGKKGNREIRRFASHSLYPTMALSPPFASLITPESVRLWSREIHPDARLISLGT